MNQKYIKKKKNTTKKRKPSKPNKMSNQIYKNITKKKTIHYYLRILVTKTLSIMVFVSTSPIHLFNSSHILSINTDKNIFIITTN